jgi:hypothetical protein
MTGLSALSRLAQRFYLAFAADELCKSASGSPLKPRPQRA